MGNFFLDSIAVFVIESKITLLKTHSTIKFFLYHSCNDEGCS